MIVASADLVAEISDGRLSAASVVLRAGVSARDFHGAFESLEDCMLAAFDEGLERLKQTLAEALPEDETMLGKIEAGLGALLSFLDEEPGWGRILLLELPVAAQTRRQRTLQELTELVSDIRFGSLLDPDPPPSKVQAARVMSELVSVIKAHMLGDDGGALVELAPELMGAVIEPELAWRGDPALDEKAPEHATNNGCGGARARVLRALAGAPGSSNRQIANTARVTRNITPRLLRALQAQGLVRNVTAGTGRGQPNAWVLTLAGEEAISGGGHGCDQAGKAA